MLVIRDTQIQALIADSDEKLAEVIENAVRKAAPVRVEGVAPDRVKPMVRRCIETAKRQGFDKAEDIAAFSALMFVLSPHYYREPAIADVLNDMRYPAGERLFQLFERVPDQAWSDAVDLYNADFWFAKKPEEIAPAELPGPEDKSGPVNYVDKTIKQADEVDAAVENAKATPTEGAMWPVEVELEKLSFYRTAAKGNPKKRAHEAAETSRKATLSKAITQPTG